MKEIFLATASCSPIGNPHCTRSPDHSLAIFMASFAAAAQLAGSESLPVFSVVRAIFRPWPSAPIRFSARGAPGPEPGLLLLGPERGGRLRPPDRRVRGQQGGDRR